MSFLEARPDIPKIEIEPLYNSNTNAKVSVKNASGIAQIEVPYEFVQNSSISPLVFFEAPQTSINFKVNFGAAQATGSNKKDVYFYQDGTPIGQKMNTEDYSSNGYILQTSVANGSNPPIKSAGVGGSKRVTAVITKDQVSDQIQFHPGIHFYNYPNFTYQSASLSAENGRYASDGTMQVIPGENNPLWLNGRVLNMGTASTGVTSKFTATLISPGGVIVQNKTFMIGVLSAGSEQVFSNESDSAGRPISGLRFNTVGLEPGRYQVLFNIDSDNVVRERDELRPGFEQFNLDQKFPSSALRTYQSNNTVSDTNHLKSFTFDVLQAEQPSYVTLQPANTTVTAGQTASFMALASGSPTPSVQWQLFKANHPNWTDIPGATSTTYSFTATLNDSGNQYRAVFANGVGSPVPSVAATLTVNSIPSVTTQPSDTTVIAGGIVSMSATASGTPTPSVQWQLFKANQPNWTDIPGATSTTYSFTATLNDSGNQYRAVFTNGVGSPIPSADATLTVNSIPSVTTQPSDTTVIVGGIVSMTATASGTPTPSVQWQVYKTNDLNWIDIPGATSTTYSFTATLNDSGNQYHAVFTNAAASTLSEAATLTVVQATVIKTSIQWGSSGAADLIDVGDGRLLPTGRTNDIAWCNIRSLSITLDRPIPSLSLTDISIKGVVGGIYPLASISGAGKSWTIILEKVIASADNVTIKMGNDQLTAYTRRLDILPGDFNDDGVVSSADITLLNNASIGSYILFSDLNGDGIVDINDGKLARFKIGTKRIL